MDGTKFNRRFLKMLLKMQCEKETLDCVIHEMRAVLGEKMPEEDAVRAYLKDPGKKTTLTVGQQVLAMDKLLEDAEVNFHMICDMVRYQNMKEAGMVHSVDEFLQLLRSGRTKAMTTCRCSSTRRWWRRCWACLRHPDTNSCMRTASRCCG